MVTGACVIPANVNYGFEVVGRDTLAGIQDGRYTDVWSHEGYAYVGTFQDPDCSNAGVFVVDIDAAISQFGADGSLEGATVAEIKSAPNTRVNDVKVHTVGDTDVLVATEEPCGADVPGAAQSGASITKDCPAASSRDTDGDGFPDETCHRNNDNGNKDEPGEQGPGPNGQKGRGGISLYDVSNPEKPTPLAKSFLDFRGVHNTFMWDWDGRSYLIGTADTFDFFDTFFVDITNPKKPELLTITGGLDWFDVGAFSDGQFETGSSAGIFNHDVWVEVIDGVPTAVVSYWDGGFVTLDVTDPANPVFLRDSTYPEINISGEPYEGNAHAAVFGGNGDYIPGVFIGQSDAEAIKAGIGLDTSTSSIYDGWGYLHVINNTDGTITVPDQGRANPSTMDVAPGEHLGYYAPAETVAAPELGTDFGDLTMHNIEADPLTQDVTPTFDAGPRVSWYSLGMRAVEYRPGHFHDDSNDEGSYSQNVHEVGRFIAEDGSNFWGIHVDTAVVDGEETQIILASDRNTGLWVFTFSCETRLDTGETVFYCDATNPDPEG